MVLKAVIISVVVLLCISELEAGQGDLAVGNAYGKELIHHEVFHRKAVPFVKRVVEREVEAPANRTIQAVVVKDLRGDGESYVQRGGPGLPSVAIKLKSPRAKGLNFILDVYA